MNVLWFRMPLRRTERTGQCVLCHSDLWDASRRAKVGEWLLAAPRFTEDLLARAVQKGSRRSLMPWVDTLDVDEALDWFCAMDEWSSVKQLPDSYPPLTGDAHDQLAAHLLSCEWDAARVLDVGAVFGQCGFPWPREGHRPLVRRGTRPYWGNIYDEPRTPRLRLHPDTPPCWIDIITQFGMTAYHHTDHADLTWRLGHHTNAVSLMMRITFLDPSGRRRPERRGPLGHGPRYAYPDDGLRRVAESADGSVFTDDDGRVVVLWR